MKKVKMTILKTMLNEDLTKEYGICGLKACSMMNVGDVFMLTTQNQRAFVTIGCSHLQLTTNVVNSFPAFFSLVFNTLQYFLGLGLSVIAPTMSTMENHHRDFSSSQMALTS